MNATTDARRGILVVEDDEPTRDALTQILTNLGHRPVVGAGTLAEGMALLDGHAFVILDLNLPDGVGTKLLARIRREGHPIRVAVASGTTDGALFAEAERLGPDLVLRKPINLHTLLQWLNSAR